MRAQLSGRAEPPRLPPWTPSERTHSLPQIPQKSRDFNEKVEQFASVPYSRVLTGNFARMRGSAACLRAWALLGYGLWVCAGLLRVPGIHARGVVRGASSSTIAWV